MQKRGSMKKQSTLKNILFLNKMYTPVIINVLYILLMIASIAGGIFLCFYEMPNISISYNFDVSVDMNRYIKEGIALIILGPIASRFCAELLIILFKINEQVEDITKQDKNRNNSSI